MAGYDPTKGLFGKVTKALKIPELGISEKYFGGETGSLGNQSQNTTQEKTTTTDTNTNTGGNTSAGGSSSGGGSAPKTSGGTPKTIADAGDSAKDAAEAAAEQARQAAMASYQAVQKAGGQAKDQAKSTYDWVLETLGSNKTDLLNKVALQETSGQQDFAKQGEDTKTNYDKARQEILSTYRDLNLQQEKILRGSGQAQSSRSVEAALKLNNLLGKDLTTISTNEADSLAMIGNALTTFNQKVSDSKMSIERESKSKADQAGLEYQQKVDAIDLNMFLSEKEKESAYKEAETKLANDIAGIETWVAQQSSLVEQSVSTQKQTLDDLIVNLTDAKGSLNSSLADKVALTNSSLQTLGYTPVSETGLEKTTSGNYQKVNQKYQSKQELDNALLTGEVTPAEYNTQLQLIENGSGSNVDTNLATNILPTTQKTTSAKTRISNDPLVSALLG